MYALRETPSSDPADLVVRLLLLPVMEGRSGAHTYSSDEVVKFGVRGRLKALQAAYVKINVCQIMELLDRLRYWGL